MPTLVNNTSSSNKKIYAASAKKESGYEYNAEDQAQGRYTLYEPNSEKGDEDADSQPGQRAGLYSKNDDSSQASKGRYEDNEELYKDSYVENEDKQPSNKSKGYYDDSKDDSYSYNADKSPTTKGTYEANEETNHSGYYDNKDAPYSYNEEDKQSPKGRYEDNDEQTTAPSKGYYEDNAENQATPQETKHSGYYDNKDASYSYNASDAKSPSKGSYEDNNEQNSAPSKGYYEDGNDDSYSYNEENTIADSMPTKVAKTYTKTKGGDGYAYNSAQSEGQPKITDGYGNDDSYGYNATSEGSTYLDNSEAVESDDEKAVKGIAGKYMDDEDYESTDSEHSNSNPIEVHQSGYMQGDEDEDSTDGYGAHYQERTGFYKDNEKTPLDASAPIPVHAPKPAASKSFLHCWPF